MLRIHAFSHEQSIDKKNNRKNDNLQLSFRKLHYEE
jgi:hypothetical protein